jgi:hypothetical protein
VFGFKFDPEKKILRLRFDFDVCLATLDLV